MSMLVEVWGDYACFTRPEMKTERVSYDVMTPSAARGLVEAIYWHPGMKYHIDRIYVLNPIRFTTIRRNEVKSTLLASAALSAAKGGPPPVLYTQEDIQQRAALLLKDVHYVIECHFTMKPLADMPWFSSLFLHFSNPILGVLAGAALTAIIQSSSASVGILQALALTGSVTYGSAIPIIMGQNIGTCVTAMISSVGASKNAKRAAFVHLYFNVIGVVLFLTAFYSLNALLHFEIIHDTVSVMGIAVIHSTFNVITTLVLLPFNRVLEKLAILTVPDGTSKDAAAPLLDKRLLGTPAVATSRAHQCTVDMAQLAQSGLLKAMSLVHIWNDQVSDEVVEKEAQVDHYEDALGTYLVQLSGLPLTVDDNRTVNTLLYSLSDLERISDHSLNLRKSALEVRDKQVTFSHQALEDLNLVEWAVQDIVNLTVQAFANQDNNAARQVEPLEQVIDEIVHQVRSRHVERLQNGQCSITNGFILADLLTCYERVADHCSNVAVAMIEVAHDSFDTHEYLQGVKADREGLDRMMDQYRKRYGLAQA